MTDPTVEKVREALIEDFVTELLRGDLINQNSSNIEGEVRQMVLNLTSRWDAVDAAEPNIEAAAGKFMDCDSALATDLKGWSRKQWAAEQAIAAAFGDNTLIRRADR